MIDEKTEKESAEKPLTERDKRGLFQPGCAPGPGRGNLKGDDVGLADLLDTIEKVIRRGMTDKDTALRLKSAALGVKLQNLRKSADDADSPPEPWVQKLIAFLNDSASRYSHKTGRPTSALEMIDILPRLCADCEILGGPASDPIVVEDGSL